MSKQDVVEQYISELDSGIARLQKEDRQDVLDFYREYILDSEMKNLTDIEAELGTPKKLARKVLADYSVATEIPETKETTKKIKQPKQENQMKTIWIIIIGLLAIPTAIPAALALLGVVFGLFMAVFGIFIGFICSIAGLILGGLMAIIAAISVIASSWAVGMFYIGMGLIAITLGLMLAPGAYYIIKLLINAITSLVKYVGRKFFNKQYYQAKEEK